MGPTVLWALCIKMVAYWTEAIQTSQASAMSTTKPAADDVDVWVLRTVGLVWVI